MGCKGLERWKQYKIIEGSREVDVGQDDFENVNYYQDIEKIFIMIFFYIQLFYIIVIFLI